MITREDVVIAISNSGSSSEVVTLLPLLKRMNIPMISMTGNPDSPWQKRHASIWISVLKQRPAHWIWPQHPALP